MWSVFFVFLSYLDGEFVKADFLSSSLEAEKESKEFFYLLNNTLCAKRSNVGEYHLLQVSDGIEEVRSVHDATGKLVDCALTTDQIQVKSFMYLCNLGLRGQVTIPVALNPSFTNITDAKLTCLQLKSKRASVDTDELQTSGARESHGKVHASALRRSKRGFTYPGTLWCGAGNNADHYDQLGEFAETDKCCRVHDHCPHVIHAFSSNYGYTNFKWHSISHCDCDNAMKACLRNVNDTSSRVVGQAFFNVIEVPCFEFSYEEQCVDRHWYGVCKQYGKVPVAVIKESIPYDFGGIDVIDELPLPPLEKTASSQEPGSEAGETTEGAGTTQSTASASASGSQTATPEAPSLTNVVTAAEDFIKVLATVSSSQGSSPDAAKEEAQGSEKKRKKNAGSGKKRKNKNRRGRGKGRKRKPNVETVVKTNEGAVGAPSCHVVEEVTSRTNVIDDPARGRQAEAKVGNFMGSEMSQEAREELSNVMMRDDPQRDASVTPSSTPQESEEREMQKDKKDSNVTGTSSTTRPPTIPSVTLSIVKTKDSDKVSTFSSTTKPPTPSVTISKNKTRRQRVRQGHLRQRPSLRAHTTLNTPTPHEGTEQQDQLITVSVRDGGEATVVESGVEAAGQLSSSVLADANDKGPVTTTTGAPTITISSLRAERRRSKERGGRKRAGEVIPPSEPTGPPHHADSGEEPARETPLVSATEASTLVGYHVVPARLDYLSVARLVPPTIRSRTSHTSWKGRRQRLKESRERRILSRIFGTSLTPTPTTVAPVQYVVDKADYDVIPTTTTSSTTTLPPRQAGTSTPVQLGPHVKDTSTRDAPLLLLTGLPPSVTQKPKWKKQERREGKRRKKAMAV
ncbi:hypothetical protein ACEWY4_008881 [Coilia grayii]|uniref:phospholipase A2 n=1 Tax=Coilia grayii TaxID=363190 RepID=A0ABD1KC74_9TELE